MLRMGDLWAQAKAPRDILAWGLACALFASWVHAEPVTREMAPPETGARIVQARGPHRLVVDKEATPNGLLFVSLGGTNSLPSDLAALDDLAAKLGYKVAALDYPNTVISTKAREAGVPDGFSQFREEIVVGTAISSIVEVDKANSIENRLIALLKAAGPDYAEFLDEGTPRWEKLVVAGHSQGSGHAAYLGKRHRLRAVVMLAGPQDTSERGLSPWLFGEGATEPENFLALLHRDDFFDCSKQLQAVAELRKQSQEEFGDDVIVLDMATKDAHMVVIDSQCRSWWEQLLRRAERAPSTPPDPRVEALKKAAIQHYVHPWSDDPLTGMSSYAIVEEQGRIWALTTSVARGPKQYAVWEWVDGNWKHLFGYHYFQELEGTDLAWDKRMDFLYKMWRLDPELRRRLEDESARKRFYF